MIWLYERVDGTERSFGSRGTWVIYLHMHQISDDGGYMFSQNFRQSGVQVFAKSLPSETQVYTSRSVCQGSEHLSADLLELSTEMLCKSLGHSFALLELAS